MDKPEALKYSRICEENRTELFHPNHLSSHYAQVSKSAPSNRKDQIWEVIDGCDAQIQYLFTAPITFSGSGRLAAGERIRIMTESNDLQPMVVSFLPLRYDELHDSLVPPDIRDTPRYKKYTLSVRAEYFYEHFRLIEDVA